MGKLGNISGKQAVKAFKKAGWKKIGQVGSHLVMVKPDMRANLSTYLRQRSGEKAQRSRNSSGRNFVLCVSVSLRLCVFARDSGGKKPGCVSLRVRDLSSYVSGHNHGGDFQTCTDILTDTLKGSTPI